MFSKYSPAQFYLSKDKRNKKSYNDSKATINKKFFKILRKELKKENSPFAKDKRLLIHLAYLFVREYLIIFPDVVKKDDVSTTNEFEAINSSNWNDVRLKLPPNYTKDLGFLVEFRPFENPITNKEKTAHTMFATLIRRMHMDSELGLNMYIPISRVNENYERSQKINAFATEKFYFRKYYCKALHNGLTESDELVELTMKEFLLGTDDFDGLK